jgi:hypothetical protein
VEFSLLLAQPFCYLVGMGKSIRRTTTITIAETWTIVWRDDHETVWQETHEPGQPPTPIAGDDGSDGTLLKLAATDPIAADEHDLITPPAPVQANADDWPAQGKIESNEKE